MYIVLCTGRALRLVFRHNIVAPQPFNIRPGPCCILIFDSEGKPLALAFRCETALGRAVADHLDTAVPLKRLDPVYLEVLLRLNSPLPFGMSTMAHVHLNAAARSSGIRASPPSCATTVAGQSSSLSLRKLPTDTCRARLPKGPTAVGLVL